MLKVRSVLRFPLTAHHSAFMFTALTPRAHPCARSLHPFGYTLMEATESGSSDGGTTTAGESVATMLNDLSQYLQSEAELSVEDYRLLQSMNLAAAEKYGDMAEEAAGLVSFAQHLQARSASLLPQIQQIDELSQQVGGDDADLSLSCNA